MSLIKRICAVLGISDTTIHTVSIARERLMAEKTLKPAEDFIVLEDADDLPRREDGSVDMDSMRALNHPAEVIEKTEKVIELKEGTLEHDLKDDELNFITDGPRQTMKFDRNPTLLPRAFRGNKEAIEEVILMLKEADRLGLYHPRWYVCRDRDANFDMNMNATSIGAMPRSMEEMAERKLCGDLGFLMSVTPFFQEHGLGHAPFGAPFCKDPTFHGKILHNNEALSAMLNLSPELISLLTDGSPVLRYTEHPLYLKPWTEVTTLDVIQAFEDILENGPEAVLAVVHTAV